MPIGDLQAAASLSEISRRPISDTSFAGALEALDAKPYRNSMKLKELRFRLYAAPLIVSLAISTAIAVQVSREQGDSLQRKFDEIAKNASSDPVRPRRTPMSELEVASYLAFNVKDKIPRGLTNPEISMLGSGNLAGRVYVDMDEFKRQRGSGGLMDPLSYVSGQVPLTARGTLRTRAGKGQFQLGSAEILGVSLPKPILQELVSFFSRTPERPRGFNMDEPFDLPAKIREVAVNQGESVIAQ